MNRVVIVLLIILLSSTTCMAQVPEWHPTVVLKVGYGDEKEELLYKGYRAGGEGEGGGIGGFYICSDKIFIVDGIRHEVKVFNLSGEYEKSIRTDWEFPPIEGKFSGRTRNVGKCDMVVSNGIIYFLGMFQSPDQFGITNSVFTFDLETGKQLERIAIHAPTLGTDLEGRRVGTRDRLIVEGEGDISVFENMRQISYPIVRGGKPVLKEEQLAGVPGIKFGAHRISVNREDPGFDFLDNSGISMKKRCELGYPAVVSPEGNYMLIHVSRSHRGNESGGCKSIAICDKNCNQLGCISLAAGSRGSCFTFGPDETLRFGPDGQLYECHDACDALYIYRWSN